MSYSYGNPGTSLRPLVGEHPTTVDDKFRLLFPQAFRDRLGEKFAMVLSEYGCIVAMPLAEFDKKWGEIQEAAALNPARRRYSREFMRYAADDLSFDKQGRVVIPTYLRGKGNLTKNVLLVGAGDVVEVWDPAEFDKYLEDEDGYGGERFSRMSTAYLKMTGQAGGGE